MRRFPQGRFGRRRSWRIAGGKPACESAWSRREGNLPRPGCAIKEGVTGVVGSEKEAGRRTWLG